VFGKILIANRGEIACRIISTARRLGIATVAVYSEADRDSLHASMADESVCIGPPPSTQSYLQIGRIVEACRETSCDAVHPGYGFLSENPAFPRALADAGLTFIGPPVAAVEAMGDKITSKRIAEKAKVNSVPGHLESLSDADEAVRVARSIGYPVMLKASAGGGGKGMRIAGNDEACRDGFERARSEAASSFGDDRIFIEKFISEPRHIEIQILADTHGNVLYLGERECSIQRRHQKVIEEAPSPLVDAGMRAAMGEQAVALARAVDYHSAGTVEFIVGSDHDFYFLEMNTRLQVEHPVTEAITGLDLVEQMIRIAAGERLDFEQSDVELNGWAIESRIYAEDPWRGFLPSSGRLVRFNPPSGRDVRLDSGVREGDEISVYYDPMIAKLITYGPDRSAAINGMQKSLNEFYIRGIRHNMSFLAAIIKRVRFTSGALSTHFIDEEFPEGFDPGQMNDDEWKILVCVAATIHDRFEYRIMGVGRLMSAEQYTGRRAVVICNGERATQAVITRTGDQDEVSIAGTVCVVDSQWAPGCHVFEGTVDGVCVCVQVDREGIGYRLSTFGVEAVLEVLSPRAAELYARMPIKEAADSSRFLIAPMPGLLVSVAVQAGDEVNQGQELAVIEAMKMENVLRAEQPRIIASVLVAPGESLSVDQPILEFA